MDNEQDRANNRKKKRKHRNRKEQSSNGGTDESSWNKQELAQSDSEPRVSIRPQSQRRRGRGGNNNVNEDDDLPEDIKRRYNGHLYDNFWTDNFPDNYYPEGAEMFLIRCGFSCCLGECCSPKRKNDYKNLLLTFTLWISIILLVVMIVEFALGGIESDLGPNSDTLLNMGAKYLRYIYCHLHIFRYVTSIFLHANIFHFLFNMLFQYRMLLQREASWGLIKTIFMYFISGIGGSIMSCAIYPQSKSVGASGALLGIYGGHIIDVVVMWKYLRNSQRMNHVINIGVFLVIMIVMGFVAEHIDHGAHLGGLLTGVFLGMVLLHRRIVVKIVGGVLLFVLFFVPTLLTYLLIKIDCAKRE